MDRYTQQQLKLLMEKFRKASKDAQYELDKEAKKYLAQLQKDVKSGRKLTQIEESILRKNARAVGKRNISKEINEFMKFKVNNTKAEDALADQLEKLWKKFKDNYNSAVYNKNYHLNDGRKYEFFAFVLAGNFANFDPSDNTPAYVSGDVFSNAGDSPVHVQIKSNGREFKMAFSDAYLRNRQVALYETYVSNVPNSSNQDTFVNIYEKRMTSAMRKNDILIDYIENNKKEKQSVKMKKAIMASYLKQVEGITSWYVFFVGGTESFSRSGNQRMAMSFAVHSKDMLKFVEENEALFTVELTTTNKKERKILSLRFNATSLNATFSPVFWGLGSSRQAYLMNGIEKSFYTIRNKYEKQNPGFIEEYNSYVKPGGVTADKFLEVYETMFGELKFK